MKKYTFINESLEGKSAKPFLRDTAAVRKYKEKNALLWDGDVTVPLATEINKVTLVINNVP